ncbi:type VI secretion system membrane subunit TssM [Spongorhabdus nitratireducens]
METALRTAISRAVTLLVILAITGGVIWLVFSQWGYRGLMILLGISICTALIGLIVYFVNRSRQREVDPEKLALQIQKQRITAYLDSCRKKLKQKFGRHWTVYQQPWFLITGDALTGKSSLLRGMGLESIEYTAFSGVACTVWVSKELLVIELESRCFEEEFSEIRLHILQYLRRKRARQPLNGVLQTIRLNSICGQPGDDITAVGDMLRHRLTELNNVLDMSLPVYLIFTHADHLADFYESVSGWLGEELEQPLGDFRTGQDVSRTITEWFEGSWHRLICQIAARFRQSLHNDHFPERKPSVMALPLQLALAGPCIVNLLEVLVAASVLYRPLRIQGYFLTSSSQDGERVDLLSRHLAGEYGFSSRLFTATGMAGHQLFARNILPRVLIPCAPLAGLNKRAERIYQCLRMSGYALLILAGGGFTGWILLSLWHEDELRSSTLSRLVVYQAEMEHQAKNKPPDVINLISLLAYLRQTREDYRHQPKWYLFRPLLEEETGKKLTRSYHDQLVKLLLPRAIEVTESFVKQQLKADDPVLLLQGLVRYQMLFDPEQLLERDLNPFLVEQIAGDVLPEAAEIQLEALLKDLFRYDDYASYKPDTELLAACRTRLDHYPEDQLAYLWLLSQPGNAARLDTAALMGNHFSDVFQLGPEVRKLQQAFTKGQFRKLDLSYTAKGLNHTQDYYERLHHIPEDSRSKPEELQHDVELSGRVSNRYFDAYISHWQQILAGIRVNRFNSLTDMRHVFMLLASKDTSPLQQIMETTTDNTRLVDDSKKTKSKDESGAKQAGDPGRAKDILPEDQKRHAEAADQALQVLSRKLKPEEALEVKVDKRFLIYQQLVPGGSDDNGGLGGRILQQMQKMYEFVSDVVEADYPGQSAFKRASAHAAGKKDALTGLRRMAGLAPQPVSGWLYSLCDQTWSLLLQQAHGWVTDRWQVDFYPDWERSIAGRFPFVAGAKQETDINDFIRILKPGGEFDSFYKTHLKPFIVNQDGKMQLASYDGQKMAITSKAMTQFGLLQAVQKRFFPTPDTKLNISYSLREAYLTPKATRYTLAANTEMLNYRHGPRVWRNFKWPVRYTEVPLQSTFYNGELQVSAQEFSGQWALARFMYACDISKNEDSSDYLLQCGQDSYQVQLLLNFDNRVNPFDKSLLTRIRLPEKI